MKMGSMPIAIIMQRRAPQHRWADDAWAAVGVVPDRGDLPRLQVLSESPDRDYYLVSGLELELYTDENDGYYENCMAPESKVFVLWRMEEGKAIPVRASVSYMEGTRMFDSGEDADGVTMPAEIYAWLADYLRKNYTPRPRKGRQHG
ncbi:MULTISPECIES: DUF3305 domain-containing protein [unclassified Massilia]|uniref:DUF3305 domain-containing protein n=1 Tax=unclassified Massilia TaxID=2609279 RepID=UPI001B835C6D|nr:MULTISPECIES: DUF3305 domain-containing protein [unclassified Massilia]MBQ5940204.1 DUF3305 domain-containing protein [Massilia sp. AB1]MBQ5965688.1 DUF3305 domain-containing protein [Massilia sp. ZL223]